MERKLGTASPVRNRRNAEVLRSRPFKADSDPNRLRIRFNQLRRCLSVPNFPIVKRTENAHSLGGRQHLRI